MSAWLPGAVALDKRGRLEGLSMVSSIVWVLGERRSCKRGQGVCMGGMLGRDRRESRSSGVNFSLCAEHNGKQIE